MLPTHVVMNRDVSDGVGTGNWELATGDDGVRLLCRKRLLVALDITI